MQRSTAVIVIVAALLVLAGLLWHAQRIGQLSGQVAGLRRQNAELDKHLQALSAQLPNVGRDAGRQAVASAMDEVLGEPLEFLRRQIPRVSGAVALATGERGAPLVHVEIAQPSVSITLSTDVGLPDLARRVVP